jgi:hypothetical protein
MSLELTKERHMSTKSSSDIPDALRHFDSLPDDAFVRPKIGAAIRNYSMTTWWREVRRGNIRVAKLSPKTRGERVGDIRAALAAKVVS